MNAAKSVRPSGIGHRDRVTEAPPGAPVVAQHRRLAVTDPVHRHERAPVRRERDVDELEVRRRDLELGELAEAAPVEQPEHAEAPDQQPRPAPVEHELPDVERLRVERTAQLTAGGRVEEVDGAVLVPDDEDLAVGPHRHGVEAPVADAADRDGGRAAHQRGQQVAAGLDRVLERDALAREQQRPVEVVLDERPRAEVPRVRGARLAARLIALAEEQRAGAARQRQQREHGAQERPQAPVRAPGARSSASLRQRPASTNARSTAFSSAACAAAQSSVDARRAPR